MGYYDVIPGTSLARVRLPSRFVARTATLCPPQAGVYLRAVPCRAVPCRAVPCHARMHMHILTDGCLDACMHGSPNTLVAKIKPAAINSASLLIVHEPTASAQQAKLSFWIRQYQAQTV